MIGARQRLRRFGRTTGTRTRSAASDCIVKTVSFGAVPLDSPQHSLDHHDKVKKLKFDVFVVGDDWVGKYDYLEEQGVTVVYTPYGRGTSSTSLKQKIATNYERLKKKSESHLPLDADTGSKSQK